MYLFVSNENILHYSMFKAVIYWEFDFFFDVFDSFTHEIHQSPYVLGKRTKH